MRIVAGCAGLRLDVVRVDLPGSLLGGRNVPTLPAWRFVDVLRVALRGVAAAAGVVQLVNACVNRLKTFRLRDGQVRVTFPIIRIERRPLRVVVVGGPSCVALGAGFRGVGDARGLERLVVPRADVGQLMAGVEASGLTIALRTVAALTLDVGELGHRLGHTGPRGGLGGPHDEAGVKFGLAHAPGEVRVLVAQIVSNRVAFQATLAGVRRGTPGR